MTNKSGYEEVKLHVGLHLYSAISLLSNLLTLERKSKSPIWPLQYII